VTAEPNQGPNITPEWFALQMRVRAYTRDAVMRYVHDARAWISDLQMAAMVRATLLVSLFALFVAVGTFTYDQWRKTIEDRQGAATGQPESPRGPGWRGPGFR